MTPQRPAVAYRLRNRRRRFVEFEPFLSQRACTLTTKLPANGGSWSGITGDGEAWRDGDQTWCWRRDIRRGQWAGAWTRQLIKDIGA